MKEYVPGQPNKLIVPIEITHVSENAYVMLQGEIDIKIQKISIICYNEEYPTRFYVDISYCCPDRPYPSGRSSQHSAPRHHHRPQYDMNEKIITVQDEIYKSKEQAEEDIREVMEKNKAKAAKAAPGTAGTPAAGSTDAGKDKTAAGGASGVLKEGPPSSPREAKNECIDIVINIE